MKQGSKHYKHTKLEPIHVIQAWDLDFIEGNIVKYVYRQKHRRASKCLDDLLKMRHYLSILIRNARRNLGK